MAFQSSLKQRLLSWRTRRQAVDGTGNRTKSETKQIRNTTPSLSSSGPLHSEQGYTAAPASAPSEEEMTEQVHTVVIAGAGIVGLVLALALDKRTGIKADLYEQAEAFHDDVGAGMGMYPNGLRVIRDISPTLLGRIQQEGYPYQQRRWERHDGTEVAVAEESVLASEDNDNHDGNKLQPIGIRRWKLQKILYEAAIEAGINIHFNKRVDDIIVDNDGSTTSSPQLIRMVFEDGSSCRTNLLLAADGSKSKVRTIVTERAGKVCQLKYTGTTCLMGTSSTPQKVRGLSLPSSPTTKCHGAFYPTGLDEQCFQFHFPTNPDTAQQSMGSWGGTTHTISREECMALAARLTAEGWDDKFVQPLQNVDKALKIGLTTLEPPLETFSYGRVVLVGDAAHPPVPFLGQGAQQGLEDAGTLALLLKEMCCVTDHNTLSLCRVDEALKVYDSLRVNRTTEMVERAQLAGMQQQKRAEHEGYNRMREEMIRRDVFYHENSSTLFPGVKHDYQDAVVRFLESNPKYKLLPVPEEDDS